MGDFVIYVDETGYGCNNVGIFEDIENNIIFVIDGNHVSMMTGSGEHL
jgi:hypothetical protein